jgi:hypothetical protein
MNDPVGVYFDRLIHFQMLGPELFITVIVGACIFGLIVTVIRFIIFFSIWKFFIRVEGREFHKGWKQADNE